MESSKDKQLFGTTIPWLLTVDLVQSGSSPDVLLKTLKWPLRLGIQAKTGIWLLVVCCLSRFGTHSGGSSNRMVFFKICTVRCVMWASLCLSPCRLFRFSSTHNCPPKPEIYPLHLANSNPRPFWESCRSPWQPGPSASFRWYRNVAKWSPSAQIKPGMLIVSVQASPRGMIRTFKDFLVCRNRPRTGTNLVQNWCQKTQSINI